jgi:hypothetical protein
MKSSDPEILYDWLMDLAKYCRMQKHQLHDFDLTLQVYVEKLVRYDPDRVRRALATWRAVNRDWPAWCELREAIEREPAEP